MEINNDTIVAIATPIGSAGVSVVRLSGSNSLKIALSFFVLKNNKQQIKPRYMYMGNITEQTLHEQCLFVYFKTPNSFTGEDVVEFQCHGGIYISNAIVDLCIKNGARLATPGEFSKRAFINGKLSLDSAEGVVDLINAKTASEVKASFNLVNGALFKKVKELQTFLTDCLAEIEVNLDYPEHDIEYETTEKINKRMQHVKQQLKQLILTEASGRIIKQGVNVLILGKPNVGKSSLLNAVLNYERAIVTDIEGTTRDTLEESYIYKDILFNLTDTAGIRESDDIVEKIGVNKAKQKIDQADIILVVLDASKQLSEQDKQVLTQVKDKNYLVVINKSDLNNDLNYEGDCIKISAKNKTNIEELKSLIYNKTIKNDIVTSDIILTNKRHLLSIKTALDITSQTIDNLFNVSLDCVALDIKQVWEVLGEITGETATEDIIDAIFSKFCLGK